MALPSTGPITMAQVASELGVGTAGINLNQSNVRTLAGKPSGAIGMSDLRGKSGVSNLTVTVNPSSVYVFETVNGSGNYDVVFSATITGGVAPYVRAWSTNTGSVQGASNGATFTVRFAYHQFGSFYSGEVRLVLTDQQGTQRTVVVPVQIEFYGQGIIWA